MLARGCSSAFPPVPSTFESTWASYDADPVVAASLRDDGGADLVFYQRDDGGCTDGPGSSEAEGGYVVAKVAATGDGYVGSRLGVTFGDQFVGKAEPSRQVGDDPARVVESRQPVVQLWIGGLTKL